MKTTTVQGQYRKERRADENYSCVRIRYMCNSTFLGTSVFLAKIFRLCAIDITKIKPLCCRMTKNGDIKNSVCP